MVGTRSGAPTEPEDVDKMTLDELNEWIERLKKRCSSVKNAALDKSALESLIWLEKQRERVHGIAAPQRSRRVRR